MCDIIDEAWSKTHVAPDIGRVRYLPLEEYYHTSAYPGVFFH